MKNIFLTITLLSAVLSVYARETMVYMREDATSKHIFMTMDSKTNQITSGSHWHLYPDISSDGRAITFVAGSSENDLSLYLFQPEIQKKEKWTVSHNGMTLQPRFAQNSKLIFYSATTDAGSKLAMINLEDGRKKIIPDMINTEASVVWDYSKMAPTIFEFEGSHYAPAPKQDGTVVYLQRNLNNKREIIAFNVKEKTVEVLDEGMSPGLAKGENKLAYTKNVNGNWDIYVRDLISGSVTRVTSNAASDFAPSFDRFDNIIFASNRDNANEFSLFKAELHEDQYKITKLVEENGASFYAPRVSGSMELTQSVNASIPGEPRSSFGAFYFDNKIFVAGGHQGAEHTYPPESFTGRMEYYDFSDGKWHQAAPRLYPCHGFQLAGFGKYIYAFGGFAYEANNNPAWKSLDVVERYDIEKDEWQVVAKMPRARSSNVAVTLGSKVYLIGGWDSTPKFNNDLDGTFHAEIDVFDFVSESFETLPTILPMKRRAFTAVEKDGNILLIGGISEGASHFDLLNDVTSFNPKSLEFKPLTKLPFATFAPAAGVLKGELYVFGGMFQMGAMSYDYVPHIYKYSFAKNTWEHTGRFLTESKGFSQVVKFKDSLGVLGGHTYQYEQDRPVSTFEVFK